jgi:threonine dehydrogenase-like Zn-dependent dehydrogenase
MHRVWMVGAQSEMLRVPLADGALVATPELVPPDLIPSCSLFRRHGHGLVRGRSGGGEAGQDGRRRRRGAVGLLGVLSAKRMGAERIIAMSRHESRQKLAREFGATDIVNERGDEGVTRIRELTNGVGADSVLESSARRSR